MHVSQVGSTPPPHPPVYPACVCFDLSCAEPFQEFDGGPCCLQFGCMVHRGYYPAEDEGLKGTMVLSPAQDALPLFLETAESAPSVTGTQVTSCGDMKTIVLGGMVAVSYYCRLSRSHRVRERYKVGGFSEVGHFFTLRL